MAQFGKRKEIPWLLFFLALGFILRVNNLSNRSLWTDEFFTLFQASGHGVDIKFFLDSLSSRQSPDLLRAKEFKIFLENDHSKSIRDVSNGLLDTDTHPPLYFWIMHFWVRRFGNGVLAVRSFSLLMGMLVVFLSYRVSLRLFDRNAAIFTSLFTSICAFSVRYSQEARAYSLAMALGLCASLFILRLEKEKKGFDALGFAVFNSLGIYVHYFYIFISIAQFAYFTFARRQDKEILDRFYLFFLCSLAFLVPWLARVILKGYNIHIAEWIFGYPGLVNKITYIFSGISRYVFIFGGTGILFRLLVFTGLSLFGYMAMLAVKEMLVKYRRQFLFCLFMFLIPLLGLFFIDVIQKGALLRQERFWAFPFLGFMPLAGYTLSNTFFTKRIIAYLVISLMLVSSVGVAKLQFGPAPKQASGWVNKESRTGISAVIVYNIRSAVFAQAYYLDDSIYLIPVSDYNQLNRAVETAFTCADRVFLARHYHPTDNSLMNQPFMEVRDIGSGFKFKAGIDIDDISVAEYVK